MEGLGIQLTQIIFQMVNFGLVVFLLWKFMLGPVQKMLDARSGKIEKSLEEAKKIEEELARIGERREKETVKAREEASRLLEEAKGMASGLEKEMVEKAREEAERMVEKAKGQIGQEREEAVRELREEVGGLAVVMAERVVRDWVAKMEGKEVRREAMKQMRKMLTVGGDKS